ncbi:MAG: tyrosine-type recombinase/integrase [Bacteroidetes bacterium]|nr:tyrosine-type recombinase/integrase [Bacteroidota bacterium]
MKHLPIYNQEFERLYKEFDTLIKTKGYGNGKPVSYQSHVREFLFFIENKGFSDIREIKASEVIAYYEYIIQRPNQRREGGLSDSMIRGHLFSLRLFFDYLLETEQIKSSPARLPKFQTGKYKERNMCSLEEIKMLYEACQSKRDKALLGIAYGCGLRRTEIQNLNTNDVNLSKGALVVREGKGNKSRTVPLANNVIKDLREYLVYERAKYFSKNNFESSPAFFISNKGLRMSGQVLCSDLKEIIKRTGNAELERKEITLHCLRHSIATHLIDKGANIEFVQRLLGHSMIDTAHLYSKRRKQQLKIRTQIQ